MMGEHLPTVAQGPSLAERVREANKRVFEQKGFDEYESNPSIFEASRQGEIRDTLRLLSERCEGGLLDVGCGTGNILRLARGHFPRYVGVDLSRSLLLELNRRHPGFLLATGAAGTTPFRADTFGVVTFYGVLHHLLDAGTALTDAYRVLAPGGTLYIDHDPNYFFGRFFHFYYRMTTLRRPGFGDSETELSEWHHTRTGGINPEELATRLRRIGFRTVQVRYRMTSNPNLSPIFRWVRTVLKAASRVIQLKSFYTHFSILAVK
jgi:ubiquinone/menaquinone biosynthesis C-methylase UbiE